MFLNVLAVFGEGDRYCLARADRLYLYDLIVIKGFLSFSHFVFSNRLAVGIQKAGGRSIRLNLVGSFNSVGYIDKSRRENGFIRVESDRYQRPIAFLYFPVGDEVEAIASR